MPNIGPLEIGKSDNAVGGVTGVALDLGGLSYLRIAFASADRSSAVRSRTSS